MLGAPTFGAFLETGGDFAFEVAMQFAPQEAQGVLAGGFEDGMFEQVR